MIFLRFFSISRHWPQENVMLEVTDDMSRWRWVRWQEIQWKLYILAWVKRYFWKFKTFNMLKGINIHHCLQDFLWSAQWAFWHPESQYLGEGIRPASLRNFSKQGNYLDFAQPLPRNRNRSQQTVETEYKNTPHFLRPADGFPHQEHRYKMTSS